MASSSEKPRSLDVLQGIVALGGITLGAIPLVGLVLGGGDGGLLGRVFGWSASGSLAWVLPVVVIAVAIGVIAMLEAMKRT